MTSGVVAMGVALSAPTACGASTVSFVCGFADAAEAVPPDPPTATTLAASGITTIAATLNGTANAQGGRSGIAYFEYGLTTAYELGQVGQVSLPLSSDDVAVSHTIVAAPTSTYHYRLVVVTDEGIAHGADVQFTTTTPPGPVPSASTLLTTPVTTTHATFNARVNCQGVAGTFMWFEWGLTTAYEFGVAGLVAVPAITGQQVFSYTVAISEGTTYHVRAVIQNANGIDQDVDNQFTTPVTPPAPFVEALAATNVTGTSARFNAGVIDYSVPGTKAYFEWGLTPSYEFGQTTHVDIAASAAEQFFFFDATNLNDSSTYYYRPVAYNSSGLTTGGGAQVMTPNIPSLPTVTTLPPSPLARTSCTFNATVGGGPESESTTTRFYYQRSGGPLEFVDSGTTATASQNVSAVSAPLTPDSDYTVYAVATNVDGQTTGGTVSFHTPPLSTGGGPPTGDTSAPDPAFLMDTTARLVGTINPNGAANTLARFVYGPTQGPPWAFSTPQQNVGGGSSPVTVTADITGLTYDSSYFCAIAATNDNAQSFEDPTPVSFVTDWTVTLTPAAPPSLGPNFAMLRMNLRANGNYTPTSGGGSGPQSIGDIDVVFEISTDGLAWSTVDLYTQTGVAEAKSGDPSWPLYGDAIGLAASTAHQWRGTVTFNNAKVPVASLQVTGSFTTPALGGYGVRTQNTVGGVIQPCYSDPGDPSSALISETVERVFISNEIKTGGSNPYDVEVLGTNSTLGASLGVAAGTVRVWFESPFPKVYTPAQQGGLRPLAFALRKTRVNDVVGLDGQTDGVTVGGTSSNVNGTAGEAYWGSSGNFKTMVGVAVVGMTPADGSTDEPRIGTATNPGFKYGSTKAGCTNLYLKNVVVANFLGGGHNTIIGDGHFVGLLGWYDTVISCRAVPAAPPADSNGYGYNEHERMNGRCRVDQRRQQIEVGNEHVKYYDPLNSATSCTEDQAESWMIDITSIPVFGKSGTYAYCGGAKGQALQIDERTDTDPTQNAISTGPGSRGRLLLKRVTMHGYLGTGATGGPGDIVTYGFDGTIEVQDCILAGAGTIRLTADLGKGTTVWQAPNGKWYTTRGFIADGLVCAPAYAQGLTKRNVGAIDLSGVYDIDIQDFDDPDDSGNLGGGSHGVKPTIDLNTDSNLGGQFQIGDNGIVRVHPPGYDNTNLDTYPGFNSFFEMRWGSSGLLGVPTITYTNAQIRKFADGVTNFANP